MLGDEVAGGLVFEEGGVDEVEMVVLHRAGGGGEGEQVIHRRGDLEGALVAVPLHPLDPLRVHHARSDDPADLFIEGANHRAFGAGMVVVVDRAIASLQRGHRRRRAAFELVIVVGVEQVVLAVVLVLHNGLGLTQPCLEARAIAHAFHARAICIATPFKVGFGEIRLVAPDPLVDQGL